MRMALVGSIFLPRSRPYQVQEIPSRNYPKLHPVPMSPSARTWLLPLRYISLISRSPPFKVQIFKLPNKDITIQKRVCKTNLVMPSALTVPTSHPLPKTALYLEPFFLCEIKNGAKKEWVYTCGYFQIRYNNIHQA